MTFCIAFVLCICFESPIHSLERILLRKSGILLFNKIIVTQNMVNIVLNISETFKNPKLPITTQLAENLKTHL